MPDLDACPSVLESRTCSIIQIGQSTYMPDFHVCPPVLESQYLADDAKQRWPVLIFIFCFDVSCYMFRAGAKLWLAKQGFSEMLRDIGPQLANMVFLYLVMGFLNHRSRQMGKQGQALRVYQVCKQQLACSLSFWNVHES